MRTDTTYLLHPSAFYSSVNDRVALYYTASAMLYTFNAFSKVIFDFFRKESTLQSLYDFLAREYEFDVEDTESVRGVEAFIEELVCNRILIQPGKVSEYPGHLENDVSDEFADSRKLFSATIELTYRCNEKCRHCYVYDECGEELTTEQVKAVLDDLSRMGVLSVVFTGGEVFVRKDIFEILEYAYQKHFAVDIYTNGTLLDGDKIIRLKALWLKGIHFSVYSHIPDKHDAVTQVPGSYARTIAALKACSLIGIPTKIKSPIFAETVDDIDGIIALAREAGASVGISKDITPKKNGDTEPLNMRILDSPDQSDIGNSIEKQLGNLYQEPAENEDRPARICSAGAKMISINPYGKVFPCVCFPLCVGDVTERSIEDIWEHSEELRGWQAGNLRVNRKDCQACPNINRCRFCPGEAMLYTGSYTSKYPDACYVTKHKVRAFSGKGVKANEGI